MDFSRCFNHNSLCWGGKTGRLNFSLNKKDKSSLQSDKESGAGHTVHHNKICDSRAGGGRFMPKLMPFLGSRNQISPFV